MAQVLPPPVVEDDVQNSWAFNITNSNNELDDEVEQTRNNLNERVPAGAPRILCAGVIPSHGTNGVIPVTGSYNLLQATRTGQGEVTVSYGSDVVPLNDVVHRFITITPNHSPNTDACIVESNVSSSTLFSYSTYLQEVGASPVEGPALSDVGVHFVVYYLP